MNDTPVMQETSSDQPTHLLQEQIIVVFQELLSHALLPLPAETEHKRGAPKKLPTQQLLLAPLIGIFKSSGSIRDIWRSLILEPVGTFPAIKITYNGVKKRIIELGSGILQDLYEHICIVLEQRDRPVHRSALPLASFATDIFAVDETYHLNNPG